MSDLSILQNQKSAHDRLAAEYRMFLRLQLDYNREYFQKLFKYFTELLPLILVAIEVPEFLEKKDELFDLCLLIRKENEDIYKIGFDVLARTLRQLEQKYNIAPETLSYLTEKEFFNFLKDRILSDSEILGKRKTFLLVKQNGENEEIFYDRNYLKTFSLEEDINSEEIIQGTSANRGYARGTVRKIIKLSDIENLQEGEILVASMTDPRYLPAIKKATAIVTDEGGITCHAAIVARELKKPCVIGTKIATRVLKDGDMIEVDADKGIVKKI
jgi:phosphohistidine swiveling domain-containing protein